MPEMPARLPATTRYSSADIAISAPPHRAVPGVKSGKEEDMVVFGI